MAKISDLSDGGSLLPTDDLVAVRSGANVKVKADNITVDRIDLGDNEKIRLGDSQDLEIYHSASDSIINDNGTGSLKLQQGGSTKLEVTTTGIDVTGTVSTTTSGTSNLRLGVNAGNSITSGGNYNVVVGDEAGTALTTGDNNVAVGYGALDAEDSGTNSVAIGYNALTAQNNDAANYNVAIGYSAGAAINSGTLNTLIGGLAGDAITTGYLNEALGYSALSANTVGRNAVAVGSFALANQNPDSASSTYNTAVGYNAGGAVTTGVQNTFFGSLAGDSVTTGTGNVAVGYDAGGTTTGTNNTLIGPGAGNLISTGSKNVVIGNYDGNEGSLDIRTASNNIVLSDGDGNVRLMSDGSGNVLAGKVAINPAADGLEFRPGTASFLAITNSVAVAGDEVLFLRRTGLSGSGTYVEFYHGSAKVGTITADGSSTAYNTSSDYRLKENVVSMTGATERLKQLAPKRFNFIVDADTTVDGFLAHEVQSVVPEAITGTKDEVDADGNAVYQGIDQSKLVPLLVATIQELEARIAALEST